MSYNLNHFKGVIQGSSIGVIKGDTRNLDYNHNPLHNPYIAVSISFSIFFSI